MTRQVINLPDMGEGVESATVVGVLVKVGDTVEAEQSIVELETDKAVAEVPSPAAGKVVEINVEADQEVALGDALITLEVAGDAAAEDSGGEKETKDKAPAPGNGQRTEPEPQAEDESPQAGAPHEPEPKKSEPAKPAAQDTPSAAPPKVEIQRGVGDPQITRPTESASVAAAPGIHRLAAELGVDLKTVVGSGKDGWITEDDVKAASGQAAAGQGAKPSAPTQADSWGPVSRERLAKIRKTIAAKMAESHRATVPVTNFDDADITELDAFRKEHRNDFAPEGIELTLLPLVIKAVVNALKNHPVINATLDLANDEIIYKHYIGIGIAVDTERGLVVPVLRNAERLSVTEIAQAAKALIDRVRSGEFDVNELRGGSFTVSNLGSVGGKYATPVINYPESAILLLGRGGEVPVARDGKVVVRKMMPLSLTYDHQIIDGAQAARFLTEVKSYLESPARLLAR